MGIAMDILRVLEETPRLSPEIINEKLPQYTIAYLKSTLTYLTDQHQVSRIVRGIYEITELGKYVLHHPLNVQDSKESKEI